MNRRSRGRGAAGGRAYFGAASAATCGAVALRSRRAAGRHPRARRQAVPRATHPGDRAAELVWAVLLAPDMLLPRKITVKGARSAQVATRWRERHP